MITWVADNVTVNNIRLHYHRTGGNKPAVILAHGITDNGLCWTRLATALQDKFDLVMVDARGHGLSDKPAQDYSALDHATDLAGLVEALDLHQPAIIGHSMGGVVAAILADMYPDYVGRLVLEDPAWYPRDEDITEAEIAQHAQEWAEAIVARKALPAAEIIDKARQENPQWADEEFAPFAQAKLQVSPYVTEYDLAPAKLWWNIIPQLQCPVLLLTGDREGQVAISPDIAQEVGTLNPQVQIVRLTGAGHNVRRDQFADYLGLVRNFLRQQKK
jgi:pimeloyl-ACP methyl ester carboxylesterase